MLKQSFILYYFTPVDGFLAAAMQTSATTTDNASSRVTKLSTSFNWLG